MTASSDSGGPVVPDNAGADEVDQLVRAALEHSRTFGPMTAYGVRNFIANHGGPSLSVGRVRSALGRMDDLQRSRCRVVRFADGSRSEPLAYQLPGGPS